MHNIAHDIRYIPIFDISIQFKLCRYCITGLMYHDMAIYRYIVASLIHTYQILLCMYVCTYSYYSNTPHMIPIQPNISFCAITYIPHTFMVNINLAAENFGGLLSQKNFWRKTLRRLIALYTKSARIKIVGG